MPLTPTFSLTPRNSNYYVANNEKARLYAYGAFFWPKLYEGYVYSFDRQHAEDKLCFHMFYAADPALDYTNSANLKLAPHIRLEYDLSSLGTKKELALIFGFEAILESHLLVFTYNGLLADETLVPGDNQFLMEVESLDHLYLYFIHARMPGFSYGGTWFFKGISGYVV